MPEDNDFSEEVSVAAKSRVSDDIIDSLPLSGKPAVKTQQPHRQSGRKRKQK